MEKITAKVDMAKGRIRFDGRLYLGDTYSIAVEGDDDACAMMFMSPKTDNPSADSPRFIVKTGRGDDGAMTLDLSAESLVDYFAEESQMDFGGSVALHAYVYNEVGDEEETISEVVADGEVCVMWRPIDFVVTEGDVQRFSELNDRIDTAYQECIDRIDTKYQETNKYISEIEEALNLLNERVDTVDRQIDEIREQYLSLEADTKAQASAVKSAVMTDYDNLVALYSQATSLASDVKEDVDGWYKKLKQTMSQWEETLEAHASNTDIHTTAEEKRELVNAITDINALIEDDEALNNIINKAVNDANESVPKLNSVKELYQDAIKVIDEKSSEAESASTKWVKAINANVKTQEEMDFETVLTKANTLIAECEKILADWSGEAVSEEKLNEYLTEMKGVVERANNEYTKGRSVLEEVRQAVSSFDDSCNNIRGLAANAQNDAINALNRAIEIQNGAYNTDTTVSSLKGVVDNMEEKLNTLETTVANLREELLASIASKAPKQVEKVAIPIFDTELWYVTSPYCRINSGDNVAVAVFSTFSCSFSNMIQIYFAIAGAESLQAGDSVNFNGSIHFPYENATGSELKVGVVLCNESGDNVYNSRVVTVTIPESLAIPGVICTVDIHGTLIANADAAAGSVSIASCIIDSVAREASFYARYYHYARFLTVPTLNERSADAFRFFTANFDGLGGNDTDTNTIPWYDGSNAKCKYEEPGIGGVATSWGSGETPLKTMPSIAGGYPGKGMKWLVRAFSTDNEYYAQNYTGLCIDIGSSALWTERSWDLRAVAARFRFDNDLIRNMGEQGSVVPFFSIDIEVPCVNDDDEIEYHAATIVAYARVDGDYGPLIVGLCMLCPTKDTKNTVYERIIPAAALYAEDGFNIDVELSLGKNTVSLWAAESDTYNDNSSQMGIYHGSDNSYAAKLRMLPLIDDDLQAAFGRPVTEFAAGKVAVSSIYGGTSIVSDYSSFAVDSILFR